MWRDGIMGANFGLALKALAQRIEGERPALIYGEQVLSWAELDAQSDAIAAALLARGLW